MIKTETIKMKKRALIYTTTDDPDNYQIQDEDENIYDDAYDVIVKSYTEIKRAEPIQHDEEEQETLNN